MNIHVLPGMRSGSFISHVGYSFEGRIQPLRQPSTISQTADASEVNVFPPSPLPASALPSNGGRAVGPGYPTVFS